MRECFFAVYEGGATEINPNGEDAGRVSRSLPWQSRRALPKPVASSSTLRASHRPAVERQPARGSPLVRIRCEINPRFSTSARHKCRGETTRAKVACVQVLRAHFSRFAPKIKPAAAFPRLVDAVTLPPALTLPARPLFRNAGGSHRPANRSCGQGKFNFGAPAASE